MTVMGVCRKGEGMMPFFKVFGFGPRIRIRAVILILAAGSLCGGCAARKTVVRPPEARPLFLSDLCREEGIQLDWDSVSQVITLTRAGRKAKILPGSPAVYVDGRKAVLDGPVVRQDGRIRLPPDFPGKILPVFREKEKQIATLYKNILLDPGHGGKDPGAVGRSGLFEKDVVLDICRRLKTNLEAMGLNVMMTREGDRFVSLDERAAMAGRIGADLFISVHANSERGHSAKGFEVFYLRPVPEDMVHYTYLNRENRAALTRYAFEHDNPVLEDIVFDLLYDHKQAESQKLAGIISRRTSAELQTGNRGIEGAGFRVLKNTLIPAVLVEVGFISNRGEEDLLKTGSYRQRIADGLTQSLADYFQEQTP